MLPGSIFDTTADSIIAHVAGNVPAGAVRHLIEELRIAPAAEDTSLFTNVDEVDVDQAGRLWVYDRPTNSILLFSGAGQLVRRIGRSGSGPGEFNGDGGMVIFPDTGLAIWDPQNARVSFFSSIGDFRTSWRTPTGFFTQNGLVTDRAGKLFLRRPISVRQKGEVIGRMGLVRLINQGASVTPQRARDALPVGDSLAPPHIEVPTATYVSTSPDGRASTGMGAQYAPNVYWAWHPDGYFVAAHGGKYEIVLARKQGKPLVIKRDYPRIALADEERKDEEARIYSVDAANQSVLEVAGPAGSGCQGATCRIWSRRATGGSGSRRAAVGTYPRGRDRSAARKNAPVRHYRAAGVWEVFADNGRFLGRVPLPARSTLVEADGDLVWAITRDEQDLQASRPDADHARAAIARADGRNRYTRRLEGIDGDGRDCAATVAVPATRRHAGNVPTPLRLFLAARHGVAVALLSGSTPREPARRRPTT